MNNQNKKQPCYAMTRDGFTALVMGFTGARANQFKEAYIKRFNEMEAQILMLQTLREQYRPLTDAIQDTRDNPQPYDYSNEADMLNRIVTGKTARKYREEKKIAKSEAIRPYLSLDTDGTNGLSSASGCWADIQCAELSGTQAKAGMVRDEMAE